MLRRVGIAVTVLGIVMMLGLLLLWLAARAFGDRIRSQRGRFGKGAIGDR